MQWSKIKSIALLILALVNVVLLVMVGTQEYSSAKYQEEARTQAVALLEKNGITFLPSEIPQDMTLSTLEVDRERMGTSEDAMATALLGEGITITQSGDTQISYTSNFGTADFYSSGRLNFTFADGVYAVGEEGYTAQATALLDQLDYDFQWVSTATQMGEDDQETTITFCQTWGGLPIFSCQTIFTYQGDSLQRIDAQRLGGTNQETEGDELRTTATILVQFLGGINDGTVSVCTEIQEMSWGYQTTLTRPITTLAPTWYIVTNTGAYYMDATTGTIQQAN